MKFKNHLLLLLLFLGIIYGVQSTLMLGSMILAAKTGIMLGNLGVGGIMMMLLAAQQNHDGSYGSLTSYGKKRTVRSVEPNPLNVTEEESERMVRQIDSTFDTFSCIPKFVCGMNAKPITEKTSLMNDYGHLLKIMFGQDDVVVDESDEDGNKKKKKKTKTKPGKGKNEELKEDDEDDWRRGDDDDDDEFEDAVNDELIEEDPGLLPFILKDVMKKGGKKRGHPEIHQQQYPLQGKKPQNTPSSILSFLPKLEVGLGSKVKDSGFDSDPFFEGFRNLRSLLPIVDMSEDDVNQPPLTIKQKMKYIRRKSREIELSDDPVLKYRIATEVGRKLKNKDDCSKVFRKCPYKWDEVTGVVDNIKKVITNHPIISGKDPMDNKVIYLKTSSGSNGNQSLLSIATAAANNDGTTVVHDLGNGKLMEVSMKLVPMHEIQVPVKVEDLVVDLKKKSSHLTTPDPTSLNFNFPTLPEVSLDPLDESTLAFQDKHSNGSWTSKHQYHQALPLFPPLPPPRYPILKEELPTMLPPIGEDDELEDAYPILLKKKPTKKTPPKVVPKEEEQDDEEDEEEEDDEDGGRIEPDVFAQRRSPFIFSMRPYPIFNNRNY